jgi:hypothetical protein
MRKAVVVPAVVLVVALVVPAGNILHANNGKFVYTLDDPYIHLALAENIAAGHYGINSSEYAAPSSSVIWPFLLVPFSALPYAYLLPVFLNTVFSLLTVVLLSRFYSRGGMLLSVASVFAFNLIGLVYTGMEHSLQLLAVAAVVSGLKGFTEKHRISKLLAFSLVAAPLVRYECLAVSMPVLVFLYASGERKKSVALFTIVAVLLGAFSLFLLSMGLDPLPASVSAKSAVVGDSGSISSILGNLSDSVRSFRGLVQLLVLVPLALVLTDRNRKPDEKLLAGAVVLAVILHMLVGRSGWFHRYGVYMWAFSILVIFHLYRELVLRHSFVYAAILLALSADYLSGYTKIPAASQNIYQQQFQMRRFVHNWLQEPVAVNDLGLVSIGYNRYVLDLWGLATPSALAEAGDPLWVDSAASVNGVNTAIVYRDEIAGVQHWTPVARMQISPPLVVCVSGGVDFLAAPWSSADSLRAKLVEFEKSLPEGINLVIFQ